MEKSTQETVKSEKAKPEKELCEGEDDGVSQLRDQESLGTIGDDMEDAHDEAIRETLAKDQVEDVRENSPVEPNDQDVRDVKETDRSKEDVVSVVMPVVEVAVKNSEVKVSPSVPASSDPSMMEPSPPSDPSAAKGQGLSPLEQKSDSPVVNNLSVSPVLTADSGREDVVSAVDEVVVENCEVDTSPALNPSSDPSMVDPSPPSDPSAAKEQGLSLLEQKSDSPVVNYVSVSPVLRTDSGKEDVVSAVSEVAVESREVEASPALSKSSDPSVVEPSLPSDPSAAKGQGLSLLQKSYDSRVVNLLSVSPVLRTPPRDGYNWRKYGQKQVKSPKGSRSYYRCTYSECCAKKIECSNDSGNMVEIVTKGLHSHEPPRKSSFSPREIRAASAITPVSEEDTVVATLPSDSAPSVSTKENICQSPKIVERKRTCENEAVEEEPEPKRRLNKENTQSSVSVSKPGKKHKHVVHAADDVGICGDGYRWRKYGQKMVKGNPNPRNYYRCTSAGCPVRKHIETAVENTKAVVITYKGEHNHDSPVPKKRHDIPTSVLLSPTSVRTRLDDQVNISSSSQCSVGRESEKQSSEALDAVGC